VTVGTGHGRRQTDEVLLAELLRGSTLERAATAAGVSVSTVERRLRQDSFRARLVDLRTDLLERVAATAAQGAMIGFRVLIEAATASDATGQPVTVPWATRVAAARTLVGAVVPLDAHVVLDRRLASVEAALAGVTRLRAVGP
jgi:hypothetical protein